MKQIPIGTCVPGHLAEDWLPVLTDKGYECFEVNFHMDYQGVDIRELAPKVNAILEGSGTYVSTLGFYCNALENEEHVRGLEYAIDNAHLFGASIVATFAGGLTGRSVPEAIPQFRKVFGELAKRAEDRGVKIAIENCPMGGTWNHAQCNIGFNPDAWRMMFDAVPSDSLGLEWEPAHQMSQLIDPIPQLREWVGKVVHMHGKDANINWDVIRRYGTTSPHACVVSRTPGFGDLDWRQIFTILQDGGYEGDISIEGYHDPLFRGEWEMTGQVQALKYLKFCRGGEFVPNPWDERANFG